MTLKNGFLFMVVLVFTACGGGGGIATTQSTPTTVTVSGTVTYDSVPFKNTTSGALDYNNITKKKVRGAIVKIEDTGGTTLGTTSTDENGFYSLQVTGTTVRVRVFAQLSKAVSSGQSSWDFQVKDNTNINTPLYVINGEYAVLGENSSQDRNLNASSGWGGSSYTSTRTAGPFSILDVVYESIQKVLIADNNIAFPPLNIFWSKDNSVGTIGPSHYSPSEVALYILGKENSDTDEYDRAVLGHEWGHYYEDQFSRSDSIGGSHGTGDTLDIRIAFGEGFATALGGLIIESPFYQDSGGAAQSSTFVAVNLEEGGSTQNAGWFSEASIYHLIYDIYDSNNDVGDSLSLDFSSLHDLLVNSQKNTPAFTSIFPYIHGLKAQNPTKLTEIDAITSNESIASITDIYGTGRARGVVHASPLYSSLSVGSSVNFVTNYASDPSRHNNKLGEYNLIKFTIPTTGNHSLNLTKVGSTSTVIANFQLQKASSVILDGLNSGTNISSVSGNFSSGTYVMAIRILSSQNSGDTFNITLQSI